MRETRIEIGVLKDIKVVIFKERYVKKTYSHLSSDVVKKLYRYKNPQQFENKELYSNSESDFDEHESH